MHTSRGGPGPGGLLRLGGSGRVFPVVGMVAPGGQRCSGSRLRCSGSCCWETSGKAQPLVLVAPRAPPPSSTPTAKGEPRARQSGRRFSLGGAQKVRVASPEEGRPGGVSGADRAGGAGIGHARSQVPGTGDGHKGVCVRPVLARGRGVPAHAVA